MKQGTLIFDEYRDRYDIRFDLTEYYGGLHCEAVWRYLPAASGSLQEWSTAITGILRAYAPKT